MQTFERLAELAKLSPEQLGTVKEWCGDDPANLATLTAEDLSAKPEDGGLGVPRLLARSVVAALVPAPAVGAVTPPTTFKVQVEAPPKGPEDLDALGVLSLMEADPTRVDELMPTFLAKAFHGGVREEDGTGVDLGMTRELEEADGYEMVLTEWRGRAVFRLNEWENKVAPWADPLHPAEPLLPDGTNPRRGRGYCYGQPGIDLSTLIPLLHWAASEGDLREVDAWTVIDRFQEGHPWASNLQGRWNRLTDLQHLQWTEDARITRGRPDRVDNLGLATPPTAAWGALVDCLLEAFTVSELYRIIHWNFGDVSNTIAWNEPPADVHQAVVNALKARKALPVFLSLVEEERPRRRHEIAALRHMLFAAPTRTDLYEALMGLSAGEWSTFRALRLPSAQRKVIAGMPARHDMALALVDHYDVPHRGLRQLADLLRP